MEKEATKDDDDDVSEKANLVYLCVSYSRDWYVLDTEASTFGKDEDMSKHNLPALFGCAVMGSKVYAIGGRVRSDFVWGGFLPPTESIQIFDTKTKRWSPGPPMNTSRALPVVVPLGGKLYVFGKFGCKGDCSKENWAEYYDPDSQKWFTLSDPPYMVIKNDFFYGGVVYGDNIIIWNYNTFYLFDTKQDSWHWVKAPCLDDFTTPCLDDFTKASIEYYTSTAAVLNDTLFWCLGNLVGFDLANNRQILKPELCNYSYPISDPPLSVVTGKGQLCLIWFDKNKHNLDVHFEKFPIWDVTKERFDRAPKEKFVFHAEGAAHIQQFAAVQWHNDGKGKDGLNGDDEKPQIPSPQDLLVRLSRTMYKENFNSFWQLQRRPRILGETDEGKFFIFSPVVEKTLQKADIPLEVFLQDLGLENYYTKFKDQQINTLPDLKALTIEDYNYLKIPVGKRRLLRCKASEL